MFSEELRKKIGSEGMESLGMAFSQANEKTGSMKFIGLETTGH